MSIVTFYAPSFELELSPMPEFVDQNNPCRFRSYNHGHLRKQVTGEKDLGRLCENLNKTPKSVSWFSFRQCEIDKFHHSIWCLLVIFFVTFFSGVYILFLW